VTKTFLAPVKKLPPELAMATGKVGWVFPIMLFWLLVVLWEHGYQRQKQFGGTPHTYLVFRS